VEDVRVTQPEDAEGAPGAPSRARRALHVVVAALVVVLLPVVLVDIFVGVFAANALLLGLFLGVAGSMAGGTRRMLYLAVSFGVAAGLGAFTAYGWWWVGLLALLASSLVRGSGSGGCRRS
jgi:predicted anti-sigma-YlaC factor YlaD